jgi:glutathione S-transferase
MSLTLIIGNKNYSSWSLRAALVLALTGVRCQERRIVLGQPETQARLREFSPSGKVPVLFTELGPVWDSLAIAEYLAERFPEAHLWPRGEYGRALARSMCAEMHSGFVALRTHLPMDLKRQAELTDLPSDARVDIERMCALWLSCRQRFGADGPFLFGHASIADAFFAPVAARFHSYAVELPPVAADYVAIIYQWPAFQRWYRAALQETETLE